eukprot:679299-Rhodomonas_salina.2
MPSPATSTAVPPCLLPPYALRATFLRSPCDRSAPSRAASAPSRAASAAVPPYLLSTSELPSHHAKLYRSTGLLGRARY